MSPRCSICRHPERASIAVSLLRDGTRYTARQYQVSRSALDRHKRHLPQTVSACQAREVAPSSDGATSLLSQLDGMIRHCESALSQAQANKSFPGAMRAIKELRAYFELKCKLESEARKHRGLPKDRPEQKSGASQLAVLRTAVVVDSMIMPCRGELDGPRARTRQALCSTFAKA